jgi:ATP-binding cassette subfamily A (ABC1) protein 3
MALDLFISVDSEASGINHSNVDLLVSKYSISIYIGMTFVNIIFFLILGLYLDQVFPNEFGKKKHPLFFIKCFFKNKEVLNRTNSAKN